MQVQWRLSQAASNLASITLRHARAACKLFLPRRAQFEMNSVEPGKQVTIIAQDQL